MTTSWRDVRDGARSHPCDGHVCDHCYLCDVVGVCCSSVSAAERQQLEASLRQRLNPLYSAVRRDVIQAKALHDAIVQDASAEVGLRELVQRDGLSAARSSVPLTLPASVGSALSNDSRKEPSRVPTA